MKEFSRKNYLNRKNNFHEFVEKIFKQNKQKKYFLHNLFNAIRDNF